MCSTLDFSGYTWNIKAPGYRYGPGGNLWSDDPSVVHLNSDGLHLKITRIGSQWWCGEVYLTKSLGYGTYTVRVGSRLDKLDKTTVAAPLFIYSSNTQELDNEYSGPGGLIASPNNAHFMVQPSDEYAYVQPPVTRFTTQIEWKPDHLTFRAWNNWDAAPPDILIATWTHSSGIMLTPGAERVHINLWLRNAQPPSSGTGDEMVIQAFQFQPA